MAVHELYPGFIKFYYVVSSRTHQQILPIVPDDDYPPGTPSDEIFFTTRAAAVVMDAWLDDYAELFAASLNNSSGNATTIAEFWKIPELGGDPVFVQAYETAKAGTSSVATVVSSQATMSFRTSLGGIYKWVQLDQVISVNLRDDTPLSASTARLSMANFLKADASPVVGRDGGYLISPIRFVTKTNDRLRKKNLLDS